MKQGHFVVKIIRCNTVMCIYKFFSSPCQQYNVYKERGAMSRGTCMEPMVQAFSRCHAHSIRSLIDSKAMYLGSDSRKLREGRVKCAGTRTHDPPASCIACRRPNDNIKKV